MRENKFRDLTIAVQVAKIRKLREKIVYAVLYRGDEYELPYEIQPASSIGPDISQVVATV